MIRMYAEDKSFFEAKILRYEHSSSEKDEWERNLLRVSLFVNMADGNEGVNIMFMLTKEVRWLKDWFESILSNQIVETRFSFYYGKIDFDVIETQQENIQLRISIDFSLGKGAQLPNKREDEFAWNEQIDFNITYVQMRRLINELDKASSLYPVR